MPKDYNNPRLADFAKQQIRKVLNLSENASVPLGFHLRELKDQLDNSIKHLPASKEPLPSLLGGPPISKAERERHKLGYAHRVQLETERHQLNMALHWASQREKYDKALRSKVSQTFYHELKSGLLSAAKNNSHLTARFFMLKPRSDGGGWPITFIVAEIRVKVPVEKIVGWEPAGPAGATPKFREVMEWRGEPAAIFYIDWDRHKVGTEAPPKAVDRDIFYWIRTVSEGILLATDVITVVGLIRRGALKALIKVSGKLVQKAGSLLEKQVTKALDDAIKGLEREFKGAASLGKRKPPSSVGEKVAKEQVEKRTAQETTKAGKNERATDRPASGRPTAKDKGAERRPYAERKTEEDFPQPTTRKESRQFGKKVEEPFDKDPDFTPLNRKGKRQFPVFDILRGTAHEGDLVSEIASKSHTTLWNKFKKMFGGLDHPKDRRKFEKAVDRLKKERLIGENVQDPSLNVIERSMLGVHPVGDVNATTFRNWLRNKLKGSISDYSKHSKGIEAYAAILRKRGIPDEKILEIIIDKIKSFELIAN